MKPALTKSPVLYVALVAALILIFEWNRERTAPRRQAQEIWHQHERVLSDLAMEKRVDLDEFHEAVLFFEKLTNITVPSDHSLFIDSMPIQDTAAALEPLRGWYAKNKHRLYWDEENNEVRLTPE